MRIHARYRTHCDSNMQGFIALCWAPLRDLSVNRRVLCRLLDTYFDSNMDQLVLLSTRTRVLLRGC